MKAAVIRLKSKQATVLLIEDDLAFISDLYEENDERSEDAMNEDHEDGLTDDQEDDGSGLAYMTEVDLNDL